MSGVVDGVWPLIPEDVGWRILVDVEGDIMDEDIEDVESNDPIIRINTQITNYEMILRIKELFENLICYMYMYVHLGFFSH